MQQSFLAKIWQLEGPRARIRKTLGRNQINSEPKTLADAGDNKVTEFSGNINKQPCKYIQFFLDVECGQPSEYPVS